MIKYYDALRTAKKEKLNKEETLSMIASLDYTIDEIIRDATVVIVASLIINILEVLNE